MSDFYKNNHTLLWKNFEIDVLAPFENDIDMDDPGTISTLFSDYAQREKNNNSEAYVNISQEIPVLGSIQFDPERKIVPEVRISSVPDYGVPMPDRIVDRPIEKHSNTITQDDIERMREIDPNVAMKMEELLKNAPHYKKYGDDGFSLEILKEYEKLARTLEPSTASITRLIVESLK